MCVIPPIDLDLGWPGRVGSGLIGSGLVWPYLNVGTVFVVEAIVLRRARDSVDLLRFEPEEPDLRIVLNDVSD